MKNHYFKIILLILSINIASCQKKLSIIGKYYYRGADIFVFSNNKYMTYFFGGIQEGTWQIKTNNRVEFIPKIPKLDFEMFGRYNKSLKDSISISFEGFHEEETFIQNGKLNNQKNPTLKRVFNKNPNGFNYPYIHLFDKKENQISFGIQISNIRDTLKKSKIYQYKIQKNYNEFIAYYKKKESDTEPFSFYIKKGVLSLNNYDISKDQEMRRFLDSMNRHENFPPSENVVLYYDEFLVYSNFGDTDIRNDIKKYKYDKKNDVYISNKVSEKMKFVYPYYKIKSAVLNVDSIKIDENSIFDTNNQSKTKYENPYPNEDIPRAKEFLILGK